MRLIHDRDLKTMRIALAFTAALFFSNNIGGQESRPRLKVPIGQIGIISSIAFSSDGKYMASGSDDNSIILWNCSSGTDIRKLATPMPVRHLFFSNDGACLFSLSGNVVTRKNLLTKWETRTGKQLGKFEFTGDQKITYVPGLNSFILTGNSKNMEKYYSQALSQDISKILEQSDAEADEAADSTFSNGLLDNQLMKDLESGKITPQEFQKRMEQNLKKQLKGFQKTNTLLDAISMEKTILLENEFEELCPITYEGKEYIIGLVNDLMPGAGKKRNSIEVWETSELLPAKYTEESRPVTTYSLENSVNPIFASPQKGFYAFDSKKRGQHYVELYHLKSSAPLAKLEYAGDNIRNGQFSTSGEMLIISSFKFENNKAKYFIEGWNTTTLKREIFFQIPDPYFSGLASLFPSGNQIASVAVYPSWQIKKYSLSGDSIGVFGGRSSAPAYFGFGGDDNEVYTNFKGQPKMVEFLTVITTAMVENEAFDQGKKLSVEERDKIVRSRMPYMGSDQQNGYNLTWDLVHGGAKQTIASAYSDNHRLISSDRNYLLQSDTYQTINAPPNKSYITFLRPSERGLSPDISRKLKEYYDTSNAVYKYLYAGNKNGPVTWLINKKTKDTVSLVVIDSTDWVMVLQNGYYMASREGAKVLNYVSGYSVYPFDQFDLQFNRPDKVLKAIGKAGPSLIEAYHKAWMKRLKRLNIDTSLFEGKIAAPEADITNREQILPDQEKSKLKIDLQLKDPVYKLDRYNVWVNEVPLFGRNGKSLRSLKVTEYLTSVEIDLVDGINRIEVSALNSAGAESYRIPLIVNHKSAGKKKETVYFVGIGLDRFKDDKYNLQYSAKDIRDLARKLKEKYRENIIIDTIFNEQVTVSSVRNLKKRLLGTSINDKVIISYSGHGILSTDFDYYLSTYAVNFGKPEENGLPYEELENLLDSIPARRKLMLIDACHSGEVDKEELVRLESSTDSLIKGLKPVALRKDGQLGMKNSFELMQNLFVNVGKSTGATIISAAAGTQFALERNDLRNGVFTFSILDLLGKRSSIKISELKKRVGEMVMNLTGGRQMPTSRNEMIATDWEL